MNVSFLYPTAMIAKKEIMDNIRNKWIILMSIIFALLTIIMSYYGSVGFTGWQEIEVTISLMMYLVQILIPIIALMLGYAAIIGEIQTGSMSALLSQPVTRFEIILGKFIGLGCVLASTILIGFGIAGIIIAINVANTNLLDYLLFIASTILIGLVFLSIGLFFSTLFKKRTTAMGSAIFIWFFFNMIFQLVIVGVLFASLSFEDYMNFTTPSWYYAINLLNPLNVYSLFNTLSLSISSEMQIITSYPSYYTGGLMITILFIWIISFVALAYWRFHNKDI